MPITASAKKALRQSIKRKARNLTRSNAYKSAIKEFKKAVTIGKSEAQKALPKAYKAIDKAAKNGIIKKNKAARLKSAVAKLIAKK